MKFSAHAFLFATSVAVGGLALVPLACSTAGQSQKPSDPQEVEDSVERNYASELPRIPALEPDEALGSFEVLPGFRIELAAAEPLVADPVAMSFDENGRLYVVEMRGYSEDPDDLLGRVRLLEDTDHDGRFDQSVVFLDGLSWPTAVVTYGGGVFVGAAPDILFAKDTDGDGRADVQKTVFTGLSRGNVQGLVNSFHWGLDNRIHGATSTSGGSLRPADGEEQEAIGLRGRDFAFDPRTMKLEATSGGAQHGMSFDDWGRKFVSSNSDHIQMVMFEDRYVARNPYLAAPGARLSIAADGPQAKVFRISPIEPWRIVRTRLRVKGIVKGPIEGGGRPAGYFTGASGVTIYRGDAWPEKFHGSAIIGDVGSNIVHRKVLEPRGVEMVAKRGEQDREFVASRDIWFRPAQFANAPDGALYVLDVYREVIEHPDSLPPVIKKHLDLTSGRKRGRIYRIVPEDFVQRDAAHLGEASTAQLVATLGHPNGWHRDTAARLLYERQDRAAIGPLHKLVMESQQPAGRLHGLYALDGLGALSGDVVLVALDDDHPRVREHAVRLAERVAGEAPAVRAKLYEMVDDADPRVRYQLAFTLGELSGPKHNEALVELARHNALDRWMRLALQSSLVDGAADVLRQLAEDTAFRQSDPGRAMLGSLAVQIGVQNQKANVAGVLTVIEKLSADDRGVAQHLLQSLSGGLAKSGSPLTSKIAGGAIGPLLENMLAEARAKAANPSTGLVERIEAVRSLELSRFEDARGVVLPLIGHRQPQELQLAALATLTRFDHADVAELLIQAWSGLSPRLRASAVEALFARPERIPILLDALASGRLPSADIESARLKLLLNHKDKTIRDRAQRLLAKIDIGRRQDVVDAYRSALELNGDHDRGRATFRKVCSPCHRLEDFGQDIAPTLATFQNRGAEAILLNVLDPNREVNPQYVNYQLITTDGRTVTGIIVAETATSVTLKRADGEQDTVLRVHIDELASTGMSLMPEGLEKELDPQAMADLIAYLLALE